MTSIINLINLIRWLYIYIYKATVVNIPDLKRKNADDHMLKK
jgi:hypothetical protein